MSSSHQDPTWSPLTTSDAATHVVWAVVATGVDSPGAPVNPTSEFRTNQQVYLVCMVEGVKAEESHRLSVRWLLNGTLAQVAGAHSSALVTQNGAVSFALAYALPGAGAVKVYWDEPVADNNDVPNDNFLAQVVRFTVH